MTTAFHTAPGRARLAALDIGLLTVADRACLRLLHRCETATGVQLGTLIYSSRRTALRHLRQLWRLGLVERMPLPPHHGGVPVAYRLTIRGSRRLGYASRRQGSLAHIRHALDTVDVVCALSPIGAVQAWLTPLMTDDLFDGALRPDAVLVLQADAGSAVICLEVDEATEHAPTIQVKLAQYQRVLPARPGWQLLFVVPTEDRLSWLRRVAAWDDRRRVMGRSWVTTLPSVTAHGLDAAVAPIRPGGDRHPLRALLNDPRDRRCGAPVGAAAWVELLGSGGAEDVDEALAW